MNRALLLLPLAIACVNESNFADKYAKVTCDWYEECYEDEFADVYADMDECRTDIGDTWSEVVELMEQFGCTIDYDYGKDCLKDAKGMSCDEDEELESSACDNMMVCDDTTWYDTGY